MQGEHCVAFAETYRLRAKVACFPPWRHRLLVLAHLFYREAELLEHSHDCIAESKNLIARADILLNRR